MIFFKYSYADDQLYDHSDQVFILPANIYLRVAGFPLNRILEVKSKSCQKDLNDLYDLNCVSTRQPFSTSIQYENCFLVPGDIHNLPNFKALRDIYRRILSQISQDKEVIVHPFTPIWGGSEVEELQSLKTLEQDFSHTITFLLSSKRLIRFPDEFYNSLKKELEVQKMKKNDHSSRSQDPLLNLNYDHKAIQSDQIKLIVKRSLEANVDANLVLYSFGLTSIDRRNMVEFN